MQEVINKSNYQSKLLLINVSHPYTSTYRLANTLYAYDYLALSAVAFLLRCFTPSAVETKALNYQIMASPFT
jgi:hypothetical protein